MDDDAFELPVVYKGEELLLPLKVVPQGYTYKFVLQLDNDLEVIYDKDDEGAFRATLSKPDEYKGKLPDVELLKAISEVLEKLV